MDFNDTPAVNEAEVRRFIELIHAHAARAINGADPGALQLVRIHPADESISVNRYCIGDVEHMAADAIAFGAAGHNVYVEGRTVRPSLRGNRRGELQDTAWVFALVVDSDGDKGRAWQPTVPASIAVETSPGNAHFWFCLARAVDAAEGKAIGERMRKGSGADQDTGVVTQCYRVAGTPNFPGKAKRKRGRVLTEPTRILAETNASLEESLAAFVPGIHKGDHADIDAGADGDETTLPSDLLQLIRDGVAPPGRSAVFHSVVAQLKKRRWSVEAIAALFEKHASGIAHKYAGRIREEVERSYGKHASNPVPVMNDELEDEAGDAPNPVIQVLPTIRIIGGQLPRIVAETERAMINAGAPIFSRAGTLVRPCVEKMTAADGRTTVVAGLHPFVVPLLLEWMASAALFERFDGRRKGWTVIDPPREIADALLAHKGTWKIPHVSGVITTPTLRHDGSLLADRGYDTATGLYLSPGLEGLIMPEPTREAAEAGLKLLTDLFAEFSFAKPRDLSVVLSGLLTTLVRGSLPTAPMYLIRAHAPGTGKSYLVDVISAIAAGRVCPVITASRNEEETEKRLGAVLLSGTAMISIDNCARDLSGELLCQLTERSLVKIRVLGRSEMPECECHTTVFATGNNILFKGDMVRRGLTSELDALDERPELRVFRHDPLRRVLADRGAYVAAALTIMRAYLAAGAPDVCGALGSYLDWSRMVRSPLVWLKEPDPVESMDLARTEDPELGNIRELFDLWLDHFDLDQKVTTAQVIEAACATPAINDFNRQPLKELLLRVAGDYGGGGGVSPDRLGWWLRGISGRVEAGHRLNMGRLNKAKACFWLAKVVT